MQCSHNASVNAHGGTICHVIDLSSGSSKSCYLRAILKLDKHSQSVDHMSLVKKKVVFLSLGVLAGYSQ